jgi:hypothetical protein
VLNKNVARVPDVTPIAIRTESFGLNVFTPMLATLARGKAVQFICVELKKPSPGLEEACGSQIASFRFQGGFPTGEISELSRSETEDFKLTLYELSLANPADPDDCTASQILLRAKPLATTVPGQDTYLLEEDSFVHLQRPGTRADWVLRFSQDGQEEVKIVPNAKQSYFHMLNHRISVLGAGCRLPAARDGIAPGSALS